MAGQQPIMTNGDGRVIPFRPRTQARPPGERSTATQDQDHEPAGLARHGPKRVSRSEVPASKDAEDYRHRMIMNLAAMVFTLLLTGLGVWLATTIADMRRTQDCILVGRRDCARIPLPHIFPPRSAESI
jgi:hypothetical protein